MGVLSRSARFAPSAALVRAMRSSLPVHMLPEGMTTLERLTAAMASSGEMRYCCSLSGSSVTTMVRWLPPNGGGAETPGSVANSGRTRLMAKSCISPCECVALLKTSRPTATLPASKRVMNGGTVPGRHEGARAVHIADGLRHRLAHVGVRMKHQLHERRALDALALDVIDAGDVEEVILVVISQVAFHLRRVHAAVRLRDIDGGIAHLRKDIDRHALHGQDGAERDRDQRDDHGERAAEGG